MAASGTRRKPKLEPWKLGLGVSAASLRNDVRQALNLIERRGQAEPSPGACACLALIASEALLSLVKPAAALEALFQSRTLQVNDEPQHPPRYHWITASRDSGEHPWHRAYPLEPWIALRHTLCQANEQDYQLALQLAARKRAEGILEERVLLAFLFPDAGWAEAEVENCLAAEIQQWGMRFLPAFSWALLASLTNPESVMRLCRATPQSPPPDAMAGSILANLGSEAWPLLIERAENDGPEWLKPLLHRGHPELARQLAPLLSQRPLQPLILEYFQRFPSQGIGALAQVVCSGGKLKEMARVQLGQLLRNHPQLPPLEARERQLCEHLLQRAQQPLHEAALEELPEVLARPPWLTPRAPRQPLIARAQAAPYEERLHPSSSGCQPFFYEVPPPEGLAPSSTFLRLQKQLRQGHQLSLHRLDELANSEALQLLLQAPASSWQDSWTPLEPLMERFGLAALAGLLGQFSQRPREVLEVFQRVESPKLASCIAAAMKQQQHRKLATRWIQRFPEAAITGLLPLAVGDDPLRPEAEQAIRWLADWKGRDFILEQARSMGVETAAQEVLDDDPFFHFPVRLPKLPSFISVPNLPRVQLRNGKALPLQAQQHLLTMLAFSPLDPPYAGLTPVKQQCCPDSLEELAVELFQLWQSAAGPSREKWCFLALGHLGGEATVRQLVPLLKAWPQEKLFARAELGLDVLAAIGTDLALMHLHQMSLRLKSKALQERARGKLAEIALRRGLCEEELADRLVSDLGLERGGGCRLDYGPRSFNVQFDEQLRPQLLDAQGRRLKDLPRPGGQDDPELAQQAQQRWKGLKKDIKLLGDIQIARLQRAMTAERCWSPGEWTLLLLEHPLLVLLVKRLLWSYRASDEAVPELFRVAEDGTLANQNDESWCLPATGQVGLPHPLHLSSEDLLCWSQLFADYNLLQPFPQLGREVHRLDESQKSLQALLPARALRVHPGRLVGLESRGWRRGPALDGGVCCEMLKPLQRDRVAHLEFRDGIYLGALHQSGDQELGELWVEESGRRLRLGEVDALAMSELLLDWQSLK